MPIKKLRHGQEITSEFINEIIDELTSLKSQHEKAELDKSTVREESSKIEARITEWEEKYSQTLEMLPELPEILDEYLQARASRGFINEPGKSTNVFTSVGDITIEFLSTNENVYWTDDDTTSEVDKRTKRPFTGEEGYYWKR
jgi:hypothetical protein